MAKNVVVYKLITGEEIIGTKAAKTSAHSSSKYVLLDDVRTVVMQPLGNGQLTFALLPWLATAVDSQISIQEDSIIGFPLGELPKQLVDTYLQQTSGIEIASPTDNVTPLKGFDN